LKVVSAAYPANAGLLGSLRVDVVAAFCCCTDPVLARSRDRFLIREGP
jgi:hypothetical protein